MKIEKPFYQLQLIVNHKPNTTVISFVFSTNRRESKFHKRHLKMNKNVEINENPYIYIYKKKRNN